MNEGSVLDVMIEEYMLPLEVATLAGLVGLWVWVNMFNIDYAITQINIAAAGNWNYAGFNAGNYSNYSWIALGGAGVILVGLFTSFQCATEIVEGTTPGFLCGQDADGESKRNEKKA